MADKGQAMPGGGFPIGDADELGKAIRGVGRGNAPSPAIRRHIMRNAERLGLMKAIPANWQSNGVAARMTKTLGWLVTGRG